MKKEDKIKNNTFQSLVPRPQFLFILFSLFSLLSSFYLFAQESKYFYTSELLAPVIANAPEVNARSVVLIDSATGALLYQKNINEEIPPASLTKLITMHIVMNEIEEGRASYNEIIPVTVESWAQSQPPRSSLMFLAPGQKVTLREIMLGLAVSSGNDAAVAIALRFAPSMSEFADLMTQEARNMGLRVTRFAESSGISELNMTTAEEFAWFCRQYITLHPNSLKDFHSVKEFSYPLAHNLPERYGNSQSEHIPYVNRRIPHTITQNSNNLLLNNYPGVDGLKTGFINESGYNYALTAERNGTRFLAVTMGAESARHRAMDGRALLDWAFENFKSVRPKIGNLENPRLWKGRENNIEIKLVHSADFTSTINRADLNNIAYNCYFPKPITAPLTEGSIVGDLIIYDNQGELHRVPLAAARAYEKGNIFKRVWHSIRLLFIRQQAAGSRFRN